MMKKKILYFFGLVLLLFTVGVFGENSANSTTPTNSDFYKILLKYCVPREGSCGNKATYSDDKCLCSGATIYLDRECFAPKCPAGTYIYYSNDTDTCPSGTTRVYIKN